MPNTALNRTTQVLLTNKSGGNLAYGDVVVLDNTNTNGFTTTTTAGLSTRGLGVILEPNGIANNASGMVAVGGWCPKVNLNTAAGIGQFIKTHTVAGQGTPHASPQVEGDFAVALSASATPSCNLFGSPNGPLAGGSGTVTNTGTLTSGKTIIGNGTVDVTVSSLTAQFVGSSSGTAAAASMSTARILGRTTGSSGAVEEITVGTGLTLSAGSLTSSVSSGLTLVEQHTASSSASLDFTTWYSSAYDDYLIRLVNVIPANNAVSLYMRLSTNGGSSYDNSAIYDWGGGYAYIGGTGALGLSNQTEWTISGASSNSANYGVHGELEFPDPARTSGYKMLRRKVGFFDSGVSALLWNNANSAYRSGTAVNAFQFFFSAGNIASGTIRVYGYAK